MSASLTIFRGLAPEFSATSDSDVEAKIALCTQWISEDAFGARYFEAIARLAAHEFTLQARVASGFSGVGAITAESAGNLSVSYGSGNFSPAQSGDDNYFRQTTHGLAYLQIRDTRSEVGFGLLT